MSLAERVDALATLQSEDFLPAAAEGFGVILQSFGEASDTQAARLPEVAEEIILALQLEYEGKVDAVNNVHSDRNYDKNSKLLVLEGDKQHCDGQIEAILVSFEEQLEKVQSNFVNSWEV